MSTSEEDRRNSRRNRDLVKLDDDAVRIEENSRLYFRIRIITTTVECQCCCSEAVDARPTAIVCCSEAKYYRPDDYQRHGRPTSIQRDGASTDSHDVVTTGLNHVMNANCVHRSSEAKQRGDDGLEAALFHGRHQYRTLGIKHSCKSSHDTSQRARNAKGRRKQELDFNVAENEPSGPVVDIVRGPNDGIDEVTEVQEDGPDDQIASSDVAVFQMPDQRWYVECKSNDCQCGQSNGS